ncbi:MULTISPECIES: DUF7511 domain-containing protein [Natrialbaceae]|uniref:DUF7511 domain-containing protein n=1 Tax=Natrialbaceae TaxID=1644061 RepID=UPI00207D187F|nr:hypothetical protein [Natronococcus sp. CG52]
MTVNETSTPTGEQPRDATLELRTDDERVWTATPVDASKDERVSAWLSVADEDLCDLEAWR